MTGAKSKRCAGKGLLTQTASKWLLEHVFALASASRVSGELMRRVLFTAMIVVPLALGLSGCSMGSIPLSGGIFSGGEDDEAASGEVKSKQELSWLKGGKNAGSDAAAADEDGGNADQQVASASEVDVQSSEQAPAGALDDRDYGSPKLDSDTALRLINSYRSKKGLSPLKLNSRLTQAAKAHARDLARLDKISHYGSDGSNPWDRVKRTGYGAKLTAENVGTGQATIEEVIEGWKSSEGHNKNLLLPDAEDMGIALVHNDKSNFKTFWTLVVGAAM